MGPFPKEPFSKAAVWRGFSAMYHVLPAGEGLGVVPSSVISVPLRALRGSVWRLSDGESHTADINLGTLFVTGTKQLVWSRWDDSACMHIAVSAEALKEAAASFNERVTPAFLDAPLVEDPTLFHLAQALKAEVLAGCPNGEIFGDSIGAALTTHLLRNYSDMATRRRQMDEPLSHKTLRTVIELIDARLGEQLTLGEMAAAVHMSPYHFLRSFKSATGLPPHRYVMQRRIERAQELMAESGLSLEQIAERTGFSSASHLTAFFRRFTGTSPRAWQRERATIP